MTRSIADGISNSAMPAWSGTLVENQILQLAIYIQELRKGYSYADFNVASPLVIPSEVVESQELAFRVETFATGISSLPYSIAPLPDGSVLLTEKTRGLRVVSPEGVVSELIDGTPRVYSDGLQVPGILLVYGLGWMLDIAPHPDYEKNGWIYLMYGDRCADCNKLSRTLELPVSMNKLVRGRIKDGAWVDQEVIWQAPIEAYTQTPDMAAGGRIAFDDAGHVFFSVGVKGASEAEGVQDLSLPYGKIHRVNDDGSTPVDNPFVGDSRALSSIWSFGHRSPQGLEFDTSTGQLWGTEMGQRGGDEVNLLRRGQNFGWPIHSLGLKYDGTPVNYGFELGIDEDLSEIVMPIDDLTPSPAVSSFTVYQGDAFPQWRGNLLIGTLKARRLLRMVIEGETVVKTEELLNGIGRIRDIETAPDGTILLLIEHMEGGQILKIAPGSG
jgi:glucose/arabinose dehydrogenase